MSRWQRHQTALRSLPNTPTRQFRSVWSAPSQRLSQPLPERRRRPLAEEYQPTQSRKNRSRIRPPRSRQVRMSHCRRQSAKTVQARIVCMVKTRRLTLLPSLLQILVTPAEKSTASPTVPQDRRLTQKCPTIDRLNFDACHQ